MKFDDLTYKVAMANRRMIYNLVISLAKKGFISYEEAREIESPADEYLEENETEIKIEKKSEADLIEEISRLTAEKAVLQARLDKIEEIAREAFSSPVTGDINLYRAQKLADIFAIFEYDGATIGLDPSSKSEETEDGQMGIYEAIAEAEKEED